MQATSRRWVLRHGLYTGLGLFLLPVLGWGRDRNGQIAPRATDPKAPRSAREPEGPPPWAALAPYTEGASLPLGFSVASLTPVVAGSALLTLRHLSGPEAVVRVARLGATPIGIAQTRELDLLLVNGGKGRVPTDETVARVVLTMAAVVRAYEAEGPVATGALRQLGPSYC